MNLTELEFKIYSNALIRIVELINDETQMNQIRFGDQPFLQITIPTFAGSSHIYDKVVFDRNRQLFTKIKYDKFVTKDRVECFGIDLPEWLFAYMY